LSLSHSCPVWLTKRNCARAFDSSTKYFYQAACIDPCPSRFYGNDKNHICTPCVDPDALTCDANGALSCQSGYLWNRQCLPTCPSATFAVGHVCKACSDSFGVGTAVCTSNSAVTCSAGYNLYGKNCISDDQCFALGGYFPNSESSLLPKRLYLRLRLTTHLRCRWCLLHLYVQVRLRRDVQRRTRPFLVSHDAHARSYFFTNTHIRPCSTNDRWIDNNGKCAPNCVWEAYFLYTEGNTNWWRRAEYLDDSGFASQCRLCPVE
jgi:hypothetical protein